MHVGWRLGHHLHGRFIVHDQRPLPCPTTDRSDLLRIITRAEWGARHRAGFGPAPTASEVWLHHTVTFAPSNDPADEARAMRDIENIGQSRFGGGFSYSFAVMPSGRVYEGTGPGRVGAHTAKRNTIARGIVLVGNYDANPVPTPMTQAVADLLRYGAGKVGYWHAARLNGGHRDAPGASTACPGKHGMKALTIINALAQTGATLSLTGDDDMPLTTADLNAISIIVRDWANIACKNALATPLIEWPGGVKTSVLQQLAENAKGISALGGQTAALAAGQGGDPEAVRQAARDGVADAIASIDTTVAVKPAEVKGTDQ
jgi:hypothetical protein